MVVLGDSMMVLRDSMVILGDSMVVWDDAMGSQGGRHIQGGSERIRADQGGSE